MTGRLERARRGREVARKRGPGDVRAAGGVHSDAVRVILGAAAAQICRVQERAAGGIELAHEHVVAGAAQVRLKRAGRGREDGRVRFSRDVRVAGGIYRDPRSQVIAQAVDRSASQVGGVDERAARVELCHKRVMKGAAFGAAGLRRLKGPWRDWKAEVPAVGISGDVGVPQRVDGDRPALFGDEAAADVRGIQKRRPRCIEFGDIDVVGRTAGRRTVWTDGRWKVGREGRAGHDDIAGAVDADSGGLLEVVAAQIRGIDEDRIDHER